MVNSVVQHLALLEWFKDLELLAWCSLWPYWSTSLKKYGIAGCNITTSFGSRYMTFLPLHQMLLLCKIS
jgi:hypothetical protein